MRAGLAARLACLLAVAASLARADTPTLSAGATHTCAIDASDAAHCWGENTRGQIDVPTASDAAGTPVTGWRAVAASKGGCHSCGVTDDGALLCWGCDDNRELGPPPEVVGGWVAVTAGKGFTCGVDAVARAVWCWGRFLPKMPVGGSWDGPWASVSAGEDFVCAVARDDGSPRAGVAECKGWSPFGQTEVPSSARKWRFLSAGFQHVCGVDVAGAALCWGSDLFGESGLVPVVDANGTTVATVADRIEKAEDPNTDLTESELALAKHAATLRAFAETEQSFAVDGDPGDARANAWGSVAAGAHWSCGVLGPGRRLACWGKKRAYTVGGAAAAAYPTLFSRVSHLRARTAVPELSTRERSIASPDAWCAGATRRAERRRPRASSRGGARGRRAPRRRTWAPRSRLRRSKRRRRVGSAGPSARPGASRRTARRLSRAQEPHSSRASS